jgi:hypothetical protein
LSSSWPSVPSCKISVFGLVGTFIDTHWRQLMESVGKLGWKSRYHHHTLAIQERDITLTHGPAILPGIPPPKVISYYIERESLLFILFIVLLFILFWFLPSKLQLPCIILSSLYSSP